MNPYIAKILADIAQASYNPTPQAAFASWHPHYLDELKTYGFIVRVASDEEIIVVSFRGTDLSIAPLERFLDSILQIIANLDYVQLIVNDEFRIHRGYWDAISGIYETLVNTLVRHGLRQKHLFITGHSAGAAMATILAFRLHRQDIPAETYVYSSPRVGDSNFSNFFDAQIYSDPIPIRRFEYGIDPIPILFPLPPFLAEYASRSLDIIERFLPLNLEAYKSSTVEYVHAGPLFLGEPGTSGLISSIPLQKFLANRTIDWLVGKAAELWPDVFQEPDDTALPWIEVPKEVMDVKRGVEAVGSIADHISNGNIKDVFLHHHIAHFPTLLQNFSDSKS